MDIRDILTASHPHCGYNINIPHELKSAAKKLCWVYNQLFDQEARKQEILSELLGTYNPKVNIQPFFHCDYGFNIHMHGSVFINYNCVILDTSPVHFGDHVLIAPGVCISCVGHALDPEQRVRSVTTSAPIVLEDGVWVGANAVICGGVTIGRGSVIGAGSVVTHDIPAGVVAAGCPCKPLRALSSADIIQRESMLY